MDPYITSYKTDGPYEIAGELFHIMKPETGEHSALYPRDIAFSIYGNYAGIDDELVKYILEYSQDEIPYKYSFGARILFLGKEMFYEGKGYYPGLTYCISGWIWTYKWSDEPILSYDWILDLANVDEDDHMAPMEE